MKVRARLSLRSRRQTALPPPPRRTFIYAHRSIRVAPVTAGRLAVALGTAFSIALAAGFGTGALFQLHARFFALLLACAGVPVRGWVESALFPIAPPASAPLISIPRNDEISDGALFLLVAAVAVLLAVLRHVPLARGLATFALVMLIASWAAMSWNEGYWFDSVTFTTLWLRGEVLLWFVLPWISALLFIALRPGALAGFAWTLGLEVWAVVFSALRMTFCLGVLHYSGMLFFPLLWFFLGLLLTVSALLAAYSVSIRQAARAMAGGRAS